MCQDKRFFDFPCMDRQNCRKVTIIASDDYQNQVQKDSESRLLNIGGTDVRGKKAILCIGYIIVATICIVSIALLFFSRNKNESEKSKRTIGALYMTMNNPYFEVINEEIKAVVESKGDVLETRDSGMDAKVQAKQVEKFIEEKVDCILINAVDWKK